MIGRVLAIGGSDPSGGAGIQADIKTITALGGYAAAAITAITVQNTRGVTAVHPVPAAVVVAQARAVLDDVGADAIKIGMLGSAATVEAVAELMAETAAPLVIDPVLASTSGAPLLDPDAFEGLMRRLLPLAALLTPNAPEAERLTGLSIATTDDLRRAGAALLTAGVRAVLMKGGHIAGESVTDILMTPDVDLLLTSQRIETRHGHGTGCTLASACATGLAQGLTLAEAARRAHDYVAEALRRAPDLGGGSGPLDHAWPLRDP
ncbi:MAG TPA: bifunctional hydroxymethylpyrimidine kinase/phosphomethylpyrimidine kinase [Caulobacteraceae bacterium]|nr:bifunctional hydroxymethylpyrimidine kinase/phosphomethylpyrimidine kinase [Caulobacteraceae bacterium]